MKSLDTGESPVIRVRLPKKVKDQYAQACANRGTNPSADIREYIEGLLRDGGAGND